MVVPNAVVAEMHRAGKFLENPQEHELLDHYGATRLTIRQSTRRPPKFGPSIQIALETIRLRATEGITAEKRAFSVSADYPWPRTADCSFVELQLAGGKRGL